MESIPTVQTPTTWLFWLLAFGTLTLGVLRITYPQQFRSVIRSPFRSPTLGRVEIKFDVFNTLLEVWAIIAIALSLLLIREKTLVFSDWAVLARYALIIGIFLALQGTIYQLAGYVFLDQTAYSSAWQEKAQFLRWSAFLMTPFIWWLSYAGEPRQIVAWVGAGTLIVLYLWSLGRLILALFRESHLRAYHNLLYLCGLEIGPIILFLLLV
ncbi:MAG: DUF4271 domain-containing protein [Flavobacteriia bacterium]|nr:DUF4271 domain-containing protein [Flavobacteriia bacterium]